MCHYKKHWSIRRHTTPRGYALAKMQTVNAVAKASQILTYLASNGACNLSTVTRHLGFPKSTALRLLSTLVSIGFVEQNPIDLTYSISRRFVELGLKVLETYDFVHISRPYMLDLAEKTGETVNLGVLDGIDVVCIDQVSSKHSLRQDQPIGSRVRAHCTSMGKSILAILDDDQIEKTFNGKVFERLTPNTLKNIEDLKKELRIVRNKGYAIDDEEAVKGVRCAGAVISDSSGKPVAALSIAGPAVRISRSKLTEFGQLLAQTTETISEKLRA